MFKHSTRFKMAKAAEMQHRNYKFQTVFMLTAASPKQQT